MNIQMEYNAAVIRKQAWIDSANRIISFGKIMDASCYSADESDFWNHIMELVNVGYRLQ